MSRLPRKDRNRILTTLRSLAENPRPVGYRQVKAAGERTYRVRVGDYRLIYTVLDDERLIIVARVARKGEQTYKGLA